MSKQQSLFQFFGSNAPSKSPSQKINEIQSKKNKSLKKLSNEGSASPRKKDNTISVKEKVEVKVVEKNDDKGREEYDVALDSGDSSSSLSDLLSSEMSSNKEVMKQNDSPPSSPLLSILNSELETKKENITTVDCSPSKIVSYVKKNNESLSLDSIFEEEVKQMEDPTPSIILGSPLKRKIVTLSKRKPFRESNTAQEIESETQELAKFTPLMEDMNASLFNPIESKSPRKKTKNAPVQQSLNFAKPEETMPKMEQSFLDFGQKDFGKRHTCQACGMNYHKGVEDDEDLHKTFHRRWQENRFTVDFPGWQDEEVVKRLEDGSKIILISSNDPKQNSPKILRAFEIVNRELCFAPSEDCEPETILIYVGSNKKMIGFISAKSISEGFPVIPASSSSLRCEKTSYPASCGISRVWVHPDKRRKGIATQLVEMARAHMTYGSIIPKERVAFTQPTQEGKLFIAKYTGKEDFLVYSGFRLESLKQK
eukprot:TRINITY_DN10160_c0_g1_i1.p1 TRINITY_DN10160_c0_g1~~TRINITY_DN10160_c0_g1_i1.p1  ORF type:complete len:482 (-),score=148.76 TRINITY_DN10160_c0_g1_i1:21-1466(-)